MKTSKKIKKYKKIVEWKENPGQYFLVNVLFFLTLWKKMMEEPRHDYFCSNLYSSYYSYRNTFSG